MSEIKNTPGPWSVGPKGVFVVSASPIPGMREGTGHGDVEYYGGYLICESILRKEDAHLIAAAPELLKASRWAANYIDTIVDPHALKVLGALRAAIEKAEGK